MALLWFVFPVILLCLKYLFRLVSPRKAPGPFISPISSLYRIWLLKDGHGPIQYMRLHEKYGNVVQTGPKHISISDAAMIPIIYDARNAFLKSKFYDVFRPLYQGQPMDTVFTTQDVGRNKRLKAALVKNLTGCSMAFQSEIKNSIEIFIQQMKNSQGDSVDLSYWSFYWSFDITFALIFGEPYGYMTRRVDFNGWIYTFKTITSFAAILGQIPEACSWTLANETVMRFLRRFQSFPDPTQDFIMEIENRIQKHDETRHECDKTFICKVLAERRDFADSDQHVEAVNILFETFFAAAAELAVTLGTVFYCLLTNEPAYQRLTRELRGGSQLDSCSANDAETSWKNPYLNAVIKETLRLFPSNSPPMERIVPATGLTVNDYHLPGGTIVSVPQYAVHRDTAVYGKDAEVFRAERWLEADQPTLSQMDRSLLAFGRGTRACVGRDLAMLQLRMFLAQVLKHFDVTFAHPETPPTITMYWMLRHIGLDAVFSLVES
ncbi:cytochrome P450 [Xylariaceae sp. FL0804]|nr:cytochrome P450 [Xylariaceae sp. FL0804]